MNILKNKLLLLAGALAIASGGSFGAHTYLTKTAHAETEVAQTAPQAKPVAVEVVRTNPVQIWKTFSARLAAVDSADIRPQVSGILTEVRVKDGQNVDKGQVLFVIDPRTYVAERKRLQAQLRAARSSAAFARKQLVRANALLKKQAISQRVYDDRANAVAMAEADAMAASAQLMQAEINLDHAYVKATVSGRISRVEMTEGNYVTAGGAAPVLTTIVSNNGVYADFDVDENTYAQNIRPVAKDADSEKHIPVKLSMRGQTEPFAGHIYSFDNHINVSSGTIRARAFFPNKDGSLVPGMFGTLQMGSAANQDTILISEKAIGTNQDRKFVYIINAQSAAAYREVTLGTKVGDKRIILSGLEDGEQVFSGGLMRIRPGMKVTPNATQTLASAQ